MLGHGNAGERLPRRVVTIAGLLLAASAINYMDRQTLAGASLRIKNEFHLSPTQYGQIEAMFGYDLTGFTFAKSSKILRSGGLIQVASPRG